MPLRTVARVVALVHHLCLAPIVLGVSEALLGSLEAVARALVRQTFIEVVRFLSGLSTWIVSLWQPGRRATLRKSWQAWGQPRMARPSSLNAVVEALYPPTSPAVHTAEGWPWNLGNFGMHSSGLSQQQAHDAETFLQPSGAGVIVAQRGYIHDAQIWVELMVARWFDVCRHLIRMLLFLPARPSEPETARPFAAQQQPAPTSKPERSWASQWRHFLFGSRRSCRAKASQAERRPDRARFSRSQTIHTEMFRGGQTSGALQQPHGAGGVRRVHSFSTTELLHQHAAQVSSTGDAVRLAGYPFEVYDVTTPDGYILSLERIPRNSPHVIFYQHGMLDSTLSWVSGGVTGSQAFALWEAGFDVWLGNNRSCAPRRHRDPNKHGASYFLYTNNEVAVDIGAQLDYIHEAKCAELGVTRVQTATMASAGQRSGADMSMAGGIRAAAAAQHRPWHLQPDTLMSSLASMQGSWMASHAVQRSGRSGDVWTAPRSSAGPHLRPSTSEGNLLHVGTSLPSHPRSHGRTTAASCQWSRDPGREAPSPFCSAPSSCTPSSCSDDGCGEVGPSATSRHSTGRQHALGQTTMAHGRAVSWPGQSVACTYNKTEPTSCSGQSVAVTAGQPARQSYDEQQARQAQTQAPCPDMPYRLQAVAHSLGGMSMLIHCVLRGKQAAAMGVSARVASRVSRLILLTPAGFHLEKPLAAVLVGIVVPPFLRLMRLVWPGFAMPFYIPSATIRGMVFKLLRDVSSIPSLMELLLALTRIALANDASQWERAMQMPHYNAKHMPAMSLHQMLHCCQIAKSGEFRLFDRGSRTANMAAYGTPQPPDVAADYAFLRETPVDLVAGLRDGVIPPHNVRLHFARMKAAGVQVSYREFDVGHLDFTFACRDELQLYLVRLLRQ